MEEDSKNKMQFGPSEEPCRLDCCIHCSDRKEDYEGCHGWLCCVCLLLTIIFAGFFFLLFLQNDCKKCPSREGLTAKLTKYNKAYVNKYGEANGYTCEWSFPNGTLAGWKHYRKAPMKWSCQSRVILGVAVPFSSLVLMGLYCMGSALTVVFTVGGSWTPGNCSCEETPLKWKIILAWLWPCILPFAVFACLGSLVYFIARAVLHCLPCEVECRGRTAGYTKGV
jgi:hypothetical protein